MNKIMNKKVKELKMKKMNTIISQHHQCLFPILGHSKRFVDVGNQLLAGTNVARRMLRIGGPISPVHVVRRRKERNQECVLW